MKNILIAAVLLLSAFRTQAFEPRMFQPGEKVPLEVKIQGDMFEALETTELTVKQPIWIQFNKEEVLVSKDGKEWHALEEYTTGSFGAELTPTGAQIYAHVNKRIL